MMAKFKVPVASCTKLLLTETAKFIELPAFILVGILHLICILFCARDILKAKNRIVISRIIFFMKEALPIYAKKQFYWQIELNK